MNPFGRLGSLFQQARQRVSSLFQQPQPQPSPQPFQFQTAPNITRTPPRIFPENIQLVRSAQTAGSAPTPGFNINLGGITFGRPLSQTQTDGGRGGQPQPQPGGGGGGGGRQPSQPSQDLFEQAPSASEIDFDALIAPALQALGQAEEAARAGTETQLGQIEVGGKTRVGGAQLQKTQAEQELGQRQARTERGAETAISEARRGFSELERGLISRFGTGVSTGLGATAILGAQTLRNIAQTRAQLQEAVNTIETTRTGLTDTLNQTIREIEGQTESLKNQARTTLQQNLAQIGQARGELQSRRAEMVMNAMNNYRNAVAGVNQRNAEFKQKVFLGAQQADTTLESARIRANAILSRIPSLPNLQLVKDVLGEPKQIFNPRTGELTPLKFAGTDIRGFTGTTTGGIVSDADRRKQLIAQGIDPDIIDLNNNSIFNLNQR